MEGAAVAIEPSTGRVLAMLSTPGYDANELAVHNAIAGRRGLQRPRRPQAEPVDQRGDERGEPARIDLQDPRGRRRVRHRRLESRLDPAQPRSLHAARIVVAGLQRLGRHLRLRHTVTIAEAIRLSCNIPMAELAVELGSETIFEMAEKFGFNQEHTTPLTVSASSYPRSLDDAQTALTGFGQGQVTATATQVAMISAGLANDGMVMKPRLVDAVIGNDLSTVREYADEEFGRAVEADDADDVTAAMVASVANGAAQGARIDGIDVAGKTGTAENDGDEPYTLWFTGFAPADDPQVAVAVVVDNGGGMGQSGSGDALAAPIAKRIIEAVLNR